MAPESPVTTAPAASPGADGEFPPRFDGRSYNWKYDGEIRQALEGGSQPESAEQALRWTQERFAVVFQALSPEFKANRAILLEAAVQSGGTQLRHASPEVLANLDADFYAAAIDRGAPPQILGYASDGVAEDSRVTAAIARHEEKVRRHAAEVTSRYPSKSR